MMELSIRDVISSANSHQGSSVDKDINNNVTTTTTNISVLRSKGKSRLHQIIVYTAAAKISTRPRPPRQVSSLISAIQQPRTRHSPAMSSAASSTSTDTTDEIKMTAAQQVFHNLLSEILNHLERKRDYLNCGLACQTGFPVAMRKLYESFSHSSLASLWTEYGCVPVSPFAIRYRSLIPDCCLAYHAVSVLSLP
jgi:hypothetical protein